MIALLLNGKPALAVRLLIPATGAWVAEVDIDLETSSAIPSGRIPLVVGGETFLGTVDERATGRNGFNARVQLVAGGGGWDKIVAAQHFHNDAGVSSRSVYTATAAAVGETVIDPAPTRFGPDFVRSAGPASRVLAGAAWHVDQEGITRIGKPYRRSLPTNAETLDYDPLTRRAVLAADTTVWPGTHIIDTRFGELVVRDVEQTFDASGVRVIAWCESDSVTGVESAGTRLASALGALARESVGLAFLKRHAYRVVLQGVDGRLTLQAVTRGSVPDLLEAVPVWAGGNGIRHQVTPGSVVTVAFVSGDPAQPIVVDFAPDNPPAIEQSFDAIRIAFGLGTMPVAKATGVMAAINAIQTQLAAHATAWAALGALVGPIAGAAVEPIAAAVTTATSTGAAAVTAANTLIPSPRTFTD